MVTSWALALLRTELDGMRHVQRSMQYPEVARRPTSTADVHWMSSLSSLDPRRLKLVTNVLIAISSVRGWVSFRDCPSAAEQAGLAYVVTL